MVSIPPYVKNQTEELDKVYLKEKKKGEEAEFAKAKIHGLEQLETLVTERLRNRTHLIEHPAILN